MATNLDPSIRHGDLAKRGWSHEMVSIYLGKGKPWYKLGQVASVERTPQWQADRDTAADGTVIAYSRKTLAERGWTRSMIERLLGDPDIVVPLNPRGTKNFHLFRHEHVLAVEASPQWQAEVAKAAPHRVAGRKAAVTKTDKLRAAVASMQIDVPLMAITEVHRAAQKSYNEIWIRRGQPDKRADDATGDFLDRITVNYLRHRLTSYEDELEAIFGVTGAPEGRVLIKRKVLAAIGDTYPDLASECARQSANVHNSKLVDGR